MPATSFLIDTNIFIWFMGERAELSPEILKMLKNPSNKVFMSVASVWEVIIKKMQHKLKTPPDIRLAVEHINFTILPITFENVLEIAKLPLIHKDPFDRILVAQAICENLTLITSDPKIWKYKVKMLKA